MSGNTYMLMLETKYLEKSQDLCTSIESGWGPCSPHLMPTALGLTGLVLSNTEGANTLNSVVCVSVCAVMNLFISQTWGKREVSRPLPLHAFARLSHSKGSSWIARKRIRIFKQIKIT